MGVYHPGKCDITDKMGLNVSQYLLGLGISSIAASVLIILCYITILSSISRNEEPKCSLVLILFVTILSALFGFAWFIVGAVILFRSNVDCIHQGSATVIYALVLWCLSALHHLEGLCKSRSKRNNYDELN